MFLYNSKKIKDKENQNLYLNTIYKNKIGDNLKDVLAVVLIAIAIAAMVYAAIHGGLALFLSGLSLLATGILLLIYKPPKPPKSNVDSRGMPLYSGFDADPQLKGFGISIAIPFGIAKIGNIIIDKRIFGDNNALGLQQGIICDTYAFQGIVAVYNREKCIAHISQRVYNQIPPDIQDSYIHESGLYTDFGYDSNNREIIRANKKENYINSNNDKENYSGNELVQRKPFEYLNNSSNINNLKNFIIQFFTTSAKFANYPLIGQYQVTRQLEFQDYGENESGFLKEYVYNFIDAGALYFNNILSFYKNYYLFSGVIDRPINNSQYIILNINFQRINTDFNLTLGYPKYSFFVDTSKISEKIEVEKDISLDYPPQEEFSFTIDIREYTVKTELASAKDTSADNIKIQKNNGQYIPIKVEKKDSRPIATSFNIYLFDNPNLALEKILKGSIISDLPSSGHTEFKLQGLTVTIAGGTHAQEVSTSLVPIYYLNKSKRSAKIKFGISFGKGEQNFNSTLYIKGENRNYQSPLITLKGSGIYNKTKCDGDCQSPPGKIEQIIH